MNKTNIDGVLIVEGSNDVSYLSSFVNALFFITNGYDLNDRKIEFLKEAAKANKLIIMTDPDEAGEKIRNKLKETIKPIFDTKIDKITRKNTKKCGVAELTKECILSTLEPYISSNPSTVTHYDLVSLLSLSKKPKDIREKLVDKYRLIDGNNKALENQLNILKISKEEIEEFINGNQ